MRGKNRCTLGVREGEGKMGKMGDMEKIGGMERKLLHHITSYIEQKSFRPGQMKKKCPLW